MMIEDPDAAAAIIAMIGFSLFFVIWYKVFETDQ